MSGAVRKFGERITDEDRIWVSRRDGSCRAGWVERSPLDSFIKQPLRFVGDGYNSSWLLGICRLIRSDEGVPEHAPNYWCMVEQLLAEGALSPPTEQR